jgi:hypothetical protein
MVYFTATARNGKIWQNTLRKALTQKGLFANDDNNDYHDDFLHFGIVFRLLSLLGKNHLAVCVPGCVAPHRFLATAR